MENTARNLMFDLASGREIYDDEQGRVISKAEANDAVLLPMILIKMTY